MYVLLSLLVPSGQGTRDWRMRSNVQGGGLRGWPVWVGIADLDSSCSQESIAFSPWQGHILEICLKTPPSVAILGHYLHFGRYRKEVTTLVWFSTPAPQNASAHVQPSPWMRAVIPVGSKFTIQKYGDLLYNSDESDTISPSLHLLCTIARHPGLNVRTHPALLLSSK